jgi:hypothetical protein
MFSFAAINIAPSERDETGVARCLFLQQTKIGKRVPKLPQKYPIAIKYTKMALKITNDHE